MTERAQQTTVEKIALADYAGELAVLVYNWKVANPSEAHQLLG
jgi:hypothetical protein